jgi:hypothetical protein
MSLHRAKDCQMPQDTSRTAAAALVRTLRLAVVLLLVCAPSSGCINAGVMFGKVLFGDPQVKSAFEQRTGISLLEEDRKVAVVCTAPSSVTAEFDSLQYDLQEEVTRRMRIRKLNVASDDDVITALNSSGGRFNKDGLAAALDDVDYIIHIDIAQFSHTEDGNPNLYRGRSNGIVYAYEVDRGPDAGGSPRALQVFYQEFTTEYPKSQPILADNMAARVFRQRCVDQLADVVGQTFYDVDTSELFN